MLYLVGLTRDELGGSHFHIVQSQSGGEVPQLDPQSARKTFAAVHRAIHAGLVRACHDLSEGGLAVAAAEMAFAGGLGAIIDIQDMPCDGRLPATSGSGAWGDGRLSAAARLFSESNTRFLCEVRTENSSAFEAAIAGAAHAPIGAVTERDRLVIRDRGATIVESDLTALKDAWQKPLRWQ